jgi:hypothetical protein
MKINSACAFFLACLIGLFSCTGAPDKIIIPPGVSGNQETNTESYPIIESQNGSMETVMPPWVTGYLNGGISELETMAVYSGKYVFISQNRGNNFNALNQWIAMFNPAQDFPRLAAARIEKRLIAGASLYPDDEYGQYFETLVKNASDAEYPGAVKEDNYWIKRLINRPAESSAGMEQEVYDFFVLISIDKITLQTRIRALMGNIVTMVSPTRDQHAAINRIQQTFFEGF